MRRYATEYGVDPSRLTGERRRFSRDLSHPEIVYEPGKCIMCEACVRIAAEAKEELGKSTLSRLLPGLTIQLPNGERRLVDWLIFRLEFTLGNYQAIVHAVKFIHFPKQTAVRDLVSGFFDEWLLAQVQ